MATPRAARLYRGGRRRRFRQRRLIHRQPPGVGASPGARARRRRPLHLPQHTLLTAGRAAGRRAGARRRPAGRRPRRGLRSPHDPPGHGPRARRRRATRADQRPRRRLSFLRRPVDRARKRVARAGRGRHGNRRAEPARDDGSRPRRRARHRRREVYDPRHRSRSARQHLAALLARAARLHPAPPPGRYGPAGADDARAAPRVPCGCRRPSTPHTSSRSTGRGSAPSASCCARWRRTRAGSTTSSPG